MPKAGEFGDGHTGVGVDVFADVFLGQAVGGDFGSVFRADNQRNLGAGANLVIIREAGGAGGLHQRVQHCNAARHRGLHNRVKGADGVEGDHTVVGIQSQLDVVRFPGAAGFVFGEAERIAAGHCQGSLVHIADDEAGHIADEQAQGAPDSGVGPVAGAESAGIAVDAQLPGDGAVDDDHRGSAAGGSLAAGQVERLLQRRFHASHYHRKVLRAAAGHHGVDRNLLNGYGGIGRLGYAEGLGRIFAPRAQHPAHGVLSGRHDGHTVRPALLLIVILDGVVGIGYSDAAGG